MIKLVVRRKTTREYWKHTLGLTVFVMLIVYISFNLLWGLNYNRMGVMTQLSLQKGRYNKDDLHRLMSTLVWRLNTLDSIAKIDRDALNTKRILFDEAISSYKNLATRFPVIHYSYRSVKPSLFSYLGNYLGYTGYYNPFTGEAQVNTTVPEFVQPFTTCHEMGHQLGYAKENEAHFAGFLAARASDNPGFRYSVYFDMYSYSRFYLYSMDSVLAKKLDAELRPGVKQDFRELREFILKHRNPVEKVIDKLYGQFLKANQQPSGKLTYSEVIDFLVAYQKKFRKEPI
jgi:hypothetical protein